MLRRGWWIWVATAMVVAVALSSRWIASWRPRAPEARVTREFTVTSGADAGEGTLREAIFTADRSPERFRIVFRVSRVVIGTSLPPLVNPRGVVIDGGGDTLIESRLDGPLFDVAAPDVMLTRFTIDGGGEGVRIRAPRARVEGVTIRNARTGVSVAAQDVVIHQCTFTANGDAVSVDPLSTDVVIRNSRFEKQRRAGVWAVGAATRSNEALRVADNRFEANGLGVVAINVPARIERNHIAASRDTGVLLSGRFVFVRRNRVRDSVTGIQADAAEGAAIEDNEVDHNRSVGIMLKNSASCSVRGNRLHANGYGIAQVFGQRGAPNVIAGNHLLGQRLDGLYLVGASPVVRDNHSTGNKSAGIRLLDFVRGATSTPANPVLEANVLRGNAFDEPVRELLREPSPRRSGEKVPEGRMRGKP